MRISRFLTAGSIVFSSQWLAPIIAGAVGVSTFFGIVSVREVLFFAAGTVFFSAFTRWRCVE